MNISISTILTILLIVFAIILIPTFLTAKKIMRLLKKLDYEKWEYLTSSLRPFINLPYGDHSSYWVNSGRFYTFIRGGDYCSDPELERCVRVYRRNMKILSIVILAFIAFGILDIISTL